jgi:hypothetical protein
VFCGSGKVFTGNKLGYQISQRADFIDSELSSDTTFRRGIINSRDEPLSKIDKYRRLHILIGDSNLSEFTTFLKVGTTMLVLRLIEEKGVGEEFALEDPILSLREISHDPGCKKRVKMVDGTYKSAIDIQRYYLHKVRKFLRKKGELQDGENALIINHWERVLEALEDNPRSMHEEIDWIAKQIVTDRYLERHNITYQELNRWVYFIKRMKSLRLEDALFYQNRKTPDFNIEEFLRSRISQGDFIELKRHIRYSEIKFEDFFRIHRLYHGLLKLDIVFHDVRRDKGLFYKLRRNGSFRQFNYPDIMEVLWEQMKDRLKLDSYDPETLFESVIRYYSQQPPSDTRARIRGKFVRELFKSHVKGAVNWDSVSVHDVKLRKINIMNPFSSSNREVTELINETKKLARLNNTRHAQVGGPDT